MNRIAIAAATAVMLSLSAVSMPAFAQEGGVDFVTNVEFIKGHFEQAVANKQAGNAELTIAHAGHPIEEVFALIEEPIAEKNSNLASNLKSKLEALPNAANSDSASAFSQKIIEINGLLDQAVEEVVGEEATEVGLKAGVISGLLETAEHEYEEAVEGGNIVEMIEYQDASAFISRAKVAFESIEAEIDAHEAEEIEEFFGDLDSAVKAKADPVDIETLVDGIVHELGEVVPSGNEHVEYAANIEFIKGHLGKATENKDANNVELAVAHAGHPIEEVYSLIEGELAEHNSALNTKLKQELSALPNQIQSLSAADVKSKVTEINGMLDQAKAAVVTEEEMGDAKFNGLVTMALLETAEHEYEEAIEGGKIVEMIEYQDATAFIARAQTTFNAIKADLPEHEAEEIEEFFGQLNSLTKANASFEQVETVISGIVHEFEEALGLEGEGGAEEGNWAYIDRIQELLDQSVAEYREGNAQRAKALAIEAYLENFEYIEGDIEEDNPELMEKLEGDIRQDLTKMIDEGRPVAEIESHVGAVKADLETARAIVTPEFPVAIAAIAAVMALVVAIGRFKGASLTGRPSA